MAEMAWSETKPAGSGLYVWRGSPAMMALVLVHLRPTVYSAGGVLKGSVIGGTSLYDGCAIDQWAGDWIGPLPT